jgi:hypothetical protein
MDIFLIHHYFFSKTDANDRKTITDAMDMLMFDVGTPIPNSEQRSACVYFRPRQSTDQIYFKIQYGDGCSSNVSKCSTFHLWFNMFNDYFCW